MAHPWQSPTRAPAPAEEARPFDHTLILIGGLAQMTAGVAVALAGIQAIVVIIGWLQIFGVLELACGAALCFSGAPPRLDAKAPPSLGSSFR